MHTIRLLVSKFQTLMDVCGIRISHLKTEIPTLAKCFRFPRPGIRNLRKAEGFIEEFSEAIFSSKVILK